MSHVSERRPINWRSTIFILVFHLAAIVWVPWYLLTHSVSSGVWLGLGVGLVLTGLGITAGYHRFYSHRAYKAHPLVESLLLFFSTMAAEGSVIRWAYDHRNHHAFTDGDRDPYSIKRGFWFAHIMWVFREQEPIEPQRVSDLSRRPLVAFQHKYYGSCLVAANLIYVGLVALFTGNLLGSIVLCWIFRTFLVWHCTWFINSLAHTWGQHTFCRELSAVDNFLISLVTFGEGYHNFHHAFASDYRNGIRWYHFDPTKWLVWMLSKLGLTWDLRRTSSYVIDRKIVLSRQAEILKRLGAAAVPCREELKRKLQEVTDRMLEALEQLGQAMQAYRRAKKEGSTTERLGELKTEIAQLRSAMREQWLSWKRVSRGMVES